MGTEAGKQFHEIALDFEGMDGVVLAGGEIADYPALAGQIPSSALIVCADSGYRHCAPLGLTPSLLVGDFDSIDLPGGNFPPDIPTIPLSPHKNYTDSALAVEAAVERGCRSLLLAGMLGGRFDHSAANLQTMAGCLNSGVNARISDGVTHIFAAKAREKGETHLLLPHRAGCYFSLLAWTPVCHGVTIRGGRYPLNNYNLRSDEARAVSNEFLEEDVKILFRSGLLVVTTTPKR